MNDRRVVVVVVGAGLAGTLLAWRLQESGAEVTLVGIGHAGVARDPAAEPGRGEAAAEAPSGAGESESAGGFGDATAASGGLVRSFEVDLAARALATSSLAELLGDPGLREGAGFRPIGSLYLLGAPPVDHDGLHLLTARDIQEQFGFAGLPGDTVGVWEPEAGHIVPDRLRRTILARVHNTEPVTMSRLDGDAVVLTDGRRLSGDAVVIAAGAWTPALLGASDLPTSLRTKHIQYSWFEAGAAGLPAFIDETTGLYGRPGDDGRILAGLPSTRWDIDPHAPAVDPGLAAETEAVTRRRLPGLIGYQSKTVSAADCYSDPPGLKLRHVAGAVHTFTGGSGGAAKTALAASRIAAWALLDHALEPFG